MVYVVGHRGAAGVEPENTIRGFRYALELGVDYTECDVHLTKDNQLIVMHDETVDRTTNGTGAIRNLMFAEIRSLDAGKGERVPTLAEVLEIVKDKAILLIELKGEGVEEQAVQTVKSMQMETQVIFTSFHLDRIRKVKDLDSSLKVGAIFGQPPADACQQALDAGANGIGVHYRNLRRELVQEAHRRGLDVRAWNPDTVPEMQAMINLGVDGVSSNRPDLLIPLVRSSPSIWTSIYFEESPVDALSRLHAHGWQCCELSCEHLGKLAAASEQELVIEQVRNTLDELGMDMPQAHLLLDANIANPDKNKRDADLTQVLKELDVCAQLGVENAVIHPGGEVSDALRSLRVEQFKILADRAEKLGVCIAIENMMDGKDTQGYGARINELHELIDAVGSDMLGICFDTSHANVQKLDIPAAIIECGERLIATHISDNDGSGDQHKTPGYARIDWIPIVQALREIKYQGIFNLEIPGERGCPQGMLDLKVRHAYEITTWLLEQV